jgi:hypothetical protein
MPTRLLDLGLPGQPQLRLSIANETSPYMTLSHCWGQLQIKPLETANLHALCEGKEPEERTQKETASQPDKNQLRKQQISLLIETQPLSVEFSEKTLRDIAYIFIEKYSPKTHSKNCAYDFFFKKTKKGPSLPILQLWTSGRPRLLQSGFWAAHLSQKRIGETATSHI